jgi:hypothetical protein
MKNTLSRRGLLKGMLAGAGAAAGARIAGGPLIGEASAAAGETPHFVHIFFNGGLNALFAGCADKFLTGNVFGVTSTNILDVGNGVFTDKATFGTFPQFALDHWGAVGIRHNNALHTTPQNLRSGGERAILTDGAGCYLNQLAHHMGGDSAFKAVYFGDRAPAYQAQPKFKDVPLERVSDLKNALSAAGAQAPDPNDPERAAAASVLETSAAISQRQIGTNPGRLSSLTDAYTSAVASLKKPLPPPVTFNEIDQAYGLGGRSGVTTGNFASMLAGAEIMIRAAGTNVINICDFGLASWDFHQTGAGGASTNGTLSRNKFTGTGGFGGNRIAPIKTFLTRMLNAPDKNVVVAISGELVRLPNGDHGDGTVAVLFGKYVKKGLSFPVNNTARFAIATPSPKGFWAAAAAALKVPGEPFGANPHALIL